MKKIDFLFKNGTKKAVTFSYDDGVEQDKRLVKLFNKHQLKATFNLNSVLSEQVYRFDTDQLTVTRLPIYELKSLYEGHEVAVHSMTHPELVKMTADDIEKELGKDKEKLEKIVDYTIWGMAFPFGTYNDLVLAQMKKVGLLYGRTVHQTFKFDVPTTFETWHPTCHHNDDIMTLATQFLNSNELSLFYIWGHSYEFDCDENWDKFETFCDYISNRDDVWYGTNIEIMQYCEAMKKVEVKEDKLMNHSKETLWIKVLDTVYKVEPTRTLKF